MKQVMNIDSIKFGSLNNKYNKNFSLTRSYRDFKNLLILSTVKGKIDPPYSILILANMYQDYDNVLKPIGDALQSTGVIDDDKNILAVKIIKEPIKRGQMGSLKVWIETIQNKGD